MKCHVRCRLLLPLQPWERRPWLLPRAYHTSSQHDIPYTRRVVLMEARGLNFSEAAIVTWFLRLSSAWFLLTLGLAVGAARRKDIRTHSIWWVRLGGAGEVH